MRPPSAPSSREPRDRSSSRRLAPGAPVVAALAVAVVAAGACAGSPPVPAAGRGGGSPSVDLALVGGTVVRPGRGVEPDRTVLVAGGRIVRVGPTAEVAVPEGATVLDAGGRWIIPGLIDSHVHFFQSGNPFTRPDIADFRSVVPYADEVARTHARLAVTFRIWLASGVTAVADVGGPIWNFEVREAARRSALAPHVKVAGPLVSLVARPELELDDPPIIRVGSPAEARALVRRQLAHRPDYVKMWFIHRPGADLSAGEAIAHAIGEEAHGAGVPFLAHATELAVAKAALRAGADVLVHSVWDAPIDAEFIRLARGRRAVYVPTLWVRRGYAEVLGGRFQPTEVERRLADPQVLEAIARLPRSKATARATSSEALANVRRVRDAGIPIAMGTDAGNIGTVHGPSVFRELALLAEAGLTPEEVLVSATVNGARVLRMEADLGDVAPGKLADLVILDADPLVDVAHLERIHRVVRAGRVLDPAALVATAR